MDDVSLYNRIDPLTPTVFHEPWWLDAVTHGRYKVAEVFENGRVIGRLPYFLSKRCGLTRSIMPPLTHSLGPATINGEGSEMTRRLKGQSITRQLIQKLPVIPMFYIKCHREISDVIAFQGEKFQSFVQFTHEVAPQSFEYVWDNMHSKRRAAIARAQSVLSCADINDLSEFLYFNEQNLKAHNLKSSYDLDILRKLIETCIQRRKGRILAARDEKGELIAATFCVWDKKSYYFLMGTRKPNSYRGALSLLVWESIKDAMHRNLIFDFDGISNTPSAAFYASFGAPVTPRYIVTRETMAGKIALGIRTLRNRNRFYY